jgi:hypothetical protein
VAGERDAERTEPLEQLLPAALGERGRDADVAEPLLLVVEPEQERARERPVDEPAEAGDGAVGRSLVLDLDHRAATRLVRHVGTLGDDAVDARALEAVEPAGGAGRVVGRRREEERRREAAEERLQAPPALVERPVAQVLLGQCEQIEDDEGGGCLETEPLDARGRRVEAREERLEVEAGAARDDQLAVEHEARLGRREQRLDDLGEVARQRTLVATAQVDAVAVTEGEAAESIPLRFVHVAVERQLAREPRQHRRDRRRDWTHQPPRRFPARPRRNRRGRSSGPPAGKPERCDRRSREDESLEEISWNEWFEAFDANGLALVYQEQTEGGEESRFNKLVSRDSVRAG